MYVIHIGGSVDHAYDQDQSVNTGLKKEPFSQDLTPETVDIEDEQSDNSR